jgi:2-methylcitrate dehydratase PrpD
LKETFSRKLAEKIISVYSTPCDKRVESLAKSAILDTIGVLLAGSDQEAARIALMVVADEQPSGSCSVLGTARKLDQFNAAFVNGVAAHALDYDDSNYQLFGHPSVVVIPSLLAASELIEVTGSQFIKAYLAGFETAARVGLSVNPYQYRHGWHPTATIGIFAAVAGAGLLLRVTVDELANALGIAVSMASSVKSNFGSMTKPLGVGQLSKNGMLAIQLSRRGFTANTDAFEHHHGYFNVFNNGKQNYDPDLALTKWADPWAITDKGASQKRFPCCYACLAPVDGMLKIREDHHLDHRQIKAITCQVHPARYPHINVPDPDTALAAKFSVHYCLALAAIKGRLEISDFEGELNRSDDVRRLMRSVTFGRYEDNDNISGSNVTITTVDDRSYHVSIEGAYGSSVERALSPAVLHTKFMDCTKRVLSATVADRLYDMLVQLEKIEDVREIIRKSCTVEQDGGRDASNPQGYTRRADDHLGTVCL